MRLTKICKTCKEEKELLAFQRDVTKTDGLRPYCKTCTSKRRKELLSKGTIRKRNLEKNFGKGALDFYASLFEKQKGVCAVCKRAENGRYKHLSIDHNHTTGKIRGLLCNNCNRALGLLKDSVEVLEAAKHYLETH